MRPLLIFLLAATALRAETAAPAAYLRDFAAQLDVAWPKNHTLTIVAHGHSVPAGYFKTPVVDSLNAYPHLLHAALKAAHPHAVLNVTVTAIGGENSVQGAARFDRDVLPLRPDVLLLDYALNDRGPGLPAARTAWTSMITKAKAAGIKVILLTPTPDQSAKLDDPADPLNQHADQVRQLAAEHGTGLVDSLAAFKARIAAGTPLPGLMSQVNHPNRAGHDLVTAGLMQWFTPAR